MKVIDILDIYRYVFVLIDKNGIDTSDRIYVKTVKDYNKLLVEGLKEAQIKDTICERHKLSIRNLNAILKRLNREIKV